MTNRWIALGTAAAGARSFWTSTAMVPVAEAGWFTDRVARAEAAPEVRAG